MRIIGIDPASKTGFVALDEQGNVLLAKEIGGASGGSPERKIRTLHDEVWSHLQKGDKIGVEWFALTAQDTNKTSSGANWAARMAADRVCDSIISTLPGDIKTWVGVESWEGVKGSKKRKDNKAVKKEIMAAVEALYGFKPKTDNIADAFVIAKITLGVHFHRQGWEILLANPAQHDIITRLAYPEEHKRKMKEKKVAKKIKENKHQNEGKYANKPVDLIQKTVDLMNYKG